MPFIVSIASDMMAIMGIVPKCVEHRFECSTARSGASRPPIPTRGDTRISAAFAGVVEIMEDPPLEIAHRFFRFSHPGLLWLRERRESARRNAGMVSLWPGMVPSHA